MSSEDYINSITDLTFYYSKKRYKKYCKKKCIEYIEQNDLKNIVGGIFTDERENYISYILYTMKEDNGKENINEDEIKNIIEDMYNDKEMICQRIVDIIDEFQKKKGYYN
jgi:hypothetical protein